MPTGDLDDFARDLRAFTEGLQQQEILTKIGLAQERRIQERTRKGLDYLGDDFESYSAGHAHRREKKELPTDKVNLQFSLYDGMLSYLDTEVDSAKGSATLAITKPEKAEIAGYHNRGEGDNPQREFMGLSDQDADDIAELVGEEVDDLLQSLSLST